MMIINNANYIQIADTIINTDTSHTYITATRLYRARSFSSPQAIDHHSGTSWGIPVCTGVCWRVELNIKNRFKSHIIRPCQRTHTATRGARLVMLLCAYGRASRLYASPEPVPRLVPRWWCRSRASPPASTTLVVPQQSPPPG